MGSSTGWHLPREYTVVENAKKEKNGKMDPKKWSKSPKMDKNGPKSSQNGKKTPRQIASNSAAHEN
jgi:hypothetical protein